MGIADDMYDGGGAKPASFPEVGVRFEGTILSLRTKQCEVYAKPGVLEEWPDGSKKMTPIWRIQTDLEEEPDDDGQRDIYMRGNLYTAVGQAMRDAYESKPTDAMLCGSELLVVFSKTMPGKGNDRKIFEATITPKASAATDAWGDRGDDEPPPYDGPEG